MKHRVLPKDQDSSGTFAQISVSSAVQTSDVAIRIRRGDTVMEVSSDAPDRILTFERGDVPCL